MIIFGQNETIAGMDEFYIRCPVCEGSNWADVMVTSKYFHIFWIPIFPVGKDANVICKTCGVKRFGLDLDEKLIGSEYINAKTKFRHPRFTYLGIAIFALGFGIVLVESLRR
jgi:C4-type Zn-finger protein